MRRESLSFANCIKRWVYHLYLRILRIRATPKQIARGLALGVFVGCLPIIPLQTIIIIPLAVLFRASKLAGFIASFISNPINLVPFYMLLWYIGSSLLPTPHALNLDLNHLKILEIIHQGFAVFTRMFIGGLALGIPLSISVYYISFPIIQRYQEKRTQVLLHRARERKRRETLLTNIEQAPFVQKKEQETSLKNKTKESA